jgi:hypothetical protein
LEDKYPANLLSLHAEEESKTNLHLNAIRNQPDMTFAIGCVESSMNAIMHAIHFGTERDDDERAVRILGIRLFNGVASALKLLLAGYYQTSALQQRDLLETLFLLDYFRIDQSLIAEWRTSSEKERLRKFRPSIVRDALDKRDNLKSRKRQEEYITLCNLAGHPTADGFVMLRTASGGHNCGPFSDSFLLATVLEQLVKLSLQAAWHLTRLLPITEEYLKKAEDLAVRLQFLEFHARWAEKVFGRPYPRDEIDEIKTALKTLHGIEISLAARS